MHLFNVDFTNANRDLPPCLLGGSGHTKYDGYGCPFFHDYQREFLLMPVGLQASVFGVLVMAPRKDFCFVLARDASALSNEKWSVAAFSAKMRPGSLFRNGNIGFTIQNLLWNQFKLCMGINISTDEIFRNVGWYEGKNDQDKIDVNRRLQMYKTHLLAVIQRFGFDTVFRIS
jgi:hypothetical protein